MFRRCCRVLLLVFVAPLLSDVFMLLLLFLVVVIGVFKVRM